MSGRRPNLFLVGHPKTGTTALHRFLGEHPDIFMADVKEPHYFCTDFHLESDRFHGKRLFYQFRNEDSYVRLFARAKMERWVGEASAEYLTSRTAAEEIHKFDRDARIIIMLRNPVDWLNSLHNMYVNTTTENVRDFRRAIELEPHRKMGKLLAPRVRCPSWLLYTERVSYHDQVGRFFDRFGRQSVMVLVAEDFQRDNAAAYRQVLEFLGVDSSIAARFRPVNARATMRFPSLTRLVYHPAFRKMSQAIVPAELYEKAREKLVEPLLWKKDERVAHVPEDLRAELMTRFRCEVERTSALLGIDLLAKWGYERG